VTEPTPQSGATIRILLADDHTMFRQGLKEMLSTDERIEVVGEAANGAEAVELARHLQPDVVLLDVEMPVMGAREALEHLGRISPRPRVIIVTMYENARLVRELLASGASAYLVKSASLEQLLQTVHAAVEDPRESVATVPREALEWAEEGVDHLTGRELEIMLFVARGLSNRQTAIALHISEATVKRHLANIYAKLGVSSRGETTRLALSEGWITTWDVTQRDIPPS
jgi:DNA-binding NarL/FixJ family response regulator